MDEIQKRIEEIEKEIRETPYHKGTEHYIGALRARLAKLRQRLQASQSRKGGGIGFAIKKHGDATVVLVGFPSVGKSTLLNRLTNAKSPVAPYAFTTVTVIPGMMDYKGAKIQILDVPGLIEGAAEGRGRGREVLSVVRAADLLILMAEVGHERDFNRLKKELYLNEVNVPEIYVLNKLDKRRFSDLNHRSEKVVRISAEKGIGIEKLKEAIWDKLGLVRVYLRRLGGTKAIILRQGSILSDIARGKKEAKIWGPGAKFPGQQASLVTKVQDEMEVMFV